MTTVFHAKSYGRFIEIKSILREKKLHRRNHGSSFLGGSFSNRDNLGIQFNLEEKNSSKTLKDNFSSRIDPSIFIPVAPELLDFFQH